MSEQSQIISLPNAKLRQPSRRIGLIDQTIEDLNQLMIQQARLWEADRPAEVTVGLAAVQINKPLRMIIVREDESKENEARFLTLINPEITKMSGPREAALEGCLSVKDYYVNVERFRRVKVKALDINGRQLRFQATGFLARIIQHEIDHLKGLTIVDRAQPTTNAEGQTFSFCRLTPEGKFEVATDKEIEFLKI